MRYLALTLIAPCIAFGQTTYYSNQYGQSLGSSYVVGNTTYYSNQYGQPVGSALTPSTQANGYTPPTLSVPPTVLDRSASYGYTPVPVLPQLPILPMAPMLGMQK